MLTRCSITEAKGYRWCWKLEQSVAMAVCDALQSGRPEAYELRLRVRD